MRARSTRLALMAMVLASCARGPSGDPAGGRELVVFAASSLSESFGALEAGFEEAHPGVDVRCQFAGSQALRAQLEHGARADVFASADAPHVIALERLGHVAWSRPFASNALAIAVPRGGPGVERVEDLPSAERVVLGAPDVPVGAYAERFLERADSLYGAGFAERVRSHVVSREANVRLVLAKVALGEADAALVYVTDARAARADVAMVSIPPEANVQAEYVAAILTDAREPALARAWVEHLLSPEGQRVLAARGFMGAPGPAEGVAP